MYHSLVYVVSSVNVTPGVKEDRMMMTGMHTVSDIFCVGCGSIVGWKYVRFVKVICSLVCIDWHLNFMNLFSRKPHMRRARGTRKESIFWRGSRWQAQTEASTGLHMMLIWSEVMPTIYEEGLGKLKHVGHPL